MLKRKLIFIVAVVLLIMLAMTVTAFASTYYCHLYLDQSDAHTAGLYTQYVHRDAVNWGNSADYMILRLQLKGSDGTYSKVPGLDIRLAPGSLGYHESLMNMGSYNTFRTKIFPEHGLAGVEGTGDISND